MSAPAKPHINEGTTPGAEESPAVDQPAPAGAEESPAVDPPAPADAEESPAPEVPQRRLDLRVADDRLSVLLDAEDPLAEISDTLERIASAWDALGLPSPPAPEELEALLRENCSPGEDLADLVVRRGKPAVKPRDGCIDWAEDFFCEGFQVDEKTDRVNFWERIDHRNVAEGQLLATVREPQEGVPGEDVFGAVLKVAKPKSAKIRLGKGVREEATDAGREIYAACNGKVGFASGTVMVENVLIIRGDVCLETGNIHHNGHLQIEGDIREGASIETLGDVEVKGMLEPCNITAGGDLKVGGGAVGDAEHAIRVGGDMQARYLRQVSLRVAGDLNILREIAHCDIEALGKVDVSEGRIAGGRTLARKGICVAEAGADGSGITELVAGYDPELEPILQLIRKRRGKLENARDRILEALRNLPSRKEDLAPQQAELAAELDRQVKMIESGIKETEDQMKRARDESRAAANPEVVIFRELYAGTHIQLGDYRTKVRMTIRKPRIVQIRHKKAQVLPMGEGNTPVDES